MTRLFGIIGDPISQVRSPEVFNALFRERGIDAIMVPMQVIGADLGAALAGLRAIRNLEGLVITIPHKPAAARYLQRQSERVRIAGAANVLRLCAEGWEGDLFDGEGFALGLEARGVALKGKHGAILGAGGAGAAIALALLERGIGSLAIWDIDAYRASELVERLAALGLARVEVGRPGGTTDLAINATPLGMRPDDPHPLSLDDLRADAIVAEAIMKPPLTPLLIEAARRGHPIQEGRHMLDCQVPAIWTYFGLPSIPWGSDQSLL